MLEIEEIRRMSNGLIDAMLRTKNRHPSDWDSRPLLNPEITLLEEESKRRDMSALEVADEEKTIGNGWTLYALIKARGD